MYYKVLDKNEKGELTSTMMKGKDCIVYKIGEWSETTARAKDRNLGIFLCETKESAQQYINAIGDEGLVDVQDWKIYEVETEGNVRYSTNGYVMCDKVKPVKQIV